MALRGRAHGMPPKKPAKELGVGDQAPDVTLWDQDGKEFRLSDLRGQPVVLYFYPKDMTSGCTTEACQFQEQLPKFEGVDARVIGVSPDDAASHQKFRAKHGLRFTLAFDPSNEALEAFGVWQEKNMYGRKYMGVVRSTFLIGPDGTIAGAWRKVKPEGHAAEVLAAARGLAKA
jgi:peroxiredoxin Q/BCP